MSRENVELLLRGYEAFNRRDFATAFEAWDPDAEWDTTDDVLCVTRISGAGARSGVPIDSSWVHLWSYRNGLVIRCRNFRTKEQALEALSLPG